MGTGYFCGPDRRSHRSSRGKSSLSPSRILRHPALHFAVVGGLAFLAQRWWAAPALARLDEGRTVVVRSDDVERLRRAWVEERGIASKAPPPQVLLDEAVDEKILVHEAIRDGIDRNDRAVWRRLADLGHFLDLASGDDERAAEAARALGLEERDPIIRRHLTQMMELALSRPGAADMPSEAMLRDFYRRHLQRFTDAPRVSFIQVFFSADRRGAAAERDAAALRRQLGGVDPSEAPTRGDAFLQGESFAGETRSHVERVLGAEIATAVESAAPHTWVGPLRSAYGFHLVWVESREPPRPSAFETVRGRVAQMYLEGRRKELRRERLRALRALYQVAVEPQAAAPSGS